MNDTDRERTGGTSSGDASGNPPVVSSPAFKTNRQILDELLLVKLLEEPGFTSHDRNLIYARRLEEDAGVYINMIEGFYGSVPLSNFPAYWRSLLHQPVSLKD